MAARLVDLTLAIFAVSLLFIVLGGIEHHVKDWWHRRQDNRRLRRALAWYGVRSDLEHHTTNVVPIVRTVNQQLRDEVAA